MKQQKRASIQRAWFMTFNSAVSTRQANTRPRTQRTQRSPTIAIMRKYFRRDWRPAQNLINIKSARRVFCAQRRRSWRHSQTLSELFGRLESLEKRDQDYGRNWLESLIAFSTRTWAPEVNNTYCEAFFATFFVHLSHSPPLTESKYETKLLFACCSKLFL